MRFRPVAILALGVIGWTVAVCSSDPPDNAAGGAGGTSTTSTAGGSDGGGGAASGGGDVGGSGGSGGGAGGAEVDPACEPPAQSASMGTCVNVDGAGGTGGAGGGPPYAVECNPVTGEPCGAGESCTIEWGGEWGEPVRVVCTATSTAAEVCDLCDSADGPQCGNRLSCFDARCRRYCCETADCGAAGVVQCGKAKGNGNPLFTGLPELGVCMPVEP